MLSSVEHEKSFITSGPAYASACSAQGLHSPLKESLDIINGINGEHIPG